MDPVSKPVNRELAMAQWTTLKETIEEVGGEVHVMESDVSSFCYSRSITFITYLFDASK